MTDFVNTIDLYGDEVVAAKIIGRTIEEYNDDIIASIGGYAFYGCYTLASVDLPKATSIGNNAFYDCYKLASVNLPKATRIDDSAFSSCSALASVNLPKVTSIGSGAFAGCSNLNVIILGGQSVCTLKNTSAFNRTPFASGGTGGTAYVPQALIEQYQTETNWSTLYAAGTCNFVAIEGSEYE